MGSNTKAYLLSLLVCFLLVHTSVAGIVGVLKPASKFGFKIVRKVYKNLRDAPPSLPDAPPPPPDAPPQRIDGLDSVKAYLSDYGYIQYSDSFTELLDEEAVSSIKEYQKFFNLNVTGYPDDATINQMLLLRCAVPDRNFTYDLSPTNNDVPWPQGTTWFGFSNGRRNLTYGFDPENELPNDVIKVFDDSFKRWSDAITVLNLTKAEYEDADIKIGFYSFEKGTIPTNVLGASLIVSESGDNSRTKKNVTSGYMVLVLDTSWELPTYDVSNLSRENDVVDLETVAMHQIGHLLGLEHSSDEDSVMYPSILPSRQRKVNLSENDKEKIQQVYSSAAIREHGVILFGSGWEIITTTLSIGFACSVLFYY